MSSCLTITTKNSAKVWNPYGIFKFSDSYFSAKNIIRKFSEIIKRNNSSLGNILFISQITKQILHDPRQNASRREGKISIKFTSGKCVNKFRPHVKSVLVWAFLLFFRWRDISICYRMRQVLYVKQFFLLEYFFSFFTFACVSDCRIFLYEFFINNDLFYNLFHHETLLRLSWTFCFKAFSIAQRIIHFFKLKSADALAKTSQNNFQTIFFTIFFSFDFSTINCIFPGKFSLNSFLYWLNYDVG